MVHRRLGWRGVVVGLAASVAVLSIGAQNASACPGNQAGRATAVPRLPARPATAGHNSIVGLWQVTYSVGGAVWDLSYDTWHSDGTEFENAMDSPLISAVCQGTWEMAGPKTAKLHHVGWAYDSTGTVLLGTFSIDQLNTLANDGNSYRGVFTFQTYDLDGNPAGPPLQGTVAATRIVVP